jgi:hypothetical protein
MKLVCTMLRLRFPLKPYREQWEKLLGMADEIRSFIRENDGALKKIQ